METSDGGASDHMSSCSSRPHQSKADGQGPSRPFIPPPLHAGLFHDVSAFFLSQTSLEDGGLGSMCSYKGLLADTPYPHSETQMSFAIIL